MPIGKHYDLDTDGTLANNSDNTIASQKAIKTYVDNNKTVVDSALSDISENPVQNKVIKEAIDDIEVDALPSQSGQSGKFLTTDGTDASWGEVEDALNLEEIDIDVLVPPQSGQSGKFLTTDGTDVSWGEVEDALNLEEIDIDVLVPPQSGQSGKFLTTNGTVASWADPTSKTIITLTSDQSSYTLTSNNIYSVSISGSITTITFVLNIPSNTNVSNDIIVHAYIGANSPTITWGTQHFFNAEVPSIVNSGYYDITYVYNPLASYWVCKLNLVEADL